MRKLLTLTALVTLVALAPAAAPNPPALRRRRSRRPSFSTRRNSSAAVRTPRAAASPRTVPYVPPPPLCGDLNQNLSTGVAAWRIKSEPSPSSSPVPRAASLITSPHSLWGSLPGAGWVGPKANSSQNAATGEYVYETCFCLCSGFSDARLNLRGFGDDGSSAWLNGQPLGPLGGFSGTPGVAQTNDRSRFVVGQYCVAVEVNNVGGPTGLDVSGSVTATAGKCLANVTEATDDNVSSQ